MAPPRLAPPFVEGRVDKVGIGGGESAETGGGGPVGIGGGALAGTGGLVGSPGSSSGQGAGTLACGTPSGMAVEPGSGVRWRSWSSCSITHAEDLPPLAEKSTRTRLPSRFRTQPCWVGSCFRSTHAPASIISPFTLAAQPCLSDAPRSARAPSHAPCFVYRYSTAVDLPGSIYSTVAARVPLPPSTQSAALCN